MLRAADSIAAFICPPVRGEAVRSDLVTSPANRWNQRTVVPRIHFPPQIVDVDVDHVRHRLHVQPPNLLNVGRASEAVPETLFE